MNGATMEFHPAANEFPMMDEKRFSELKADIETHGLREPVTLCDGKILDGRNRSRACEELGITPETKTFDGDPWAYVWSLNGERRDLNDDCRYLIWKRCHEQSEAWIAKQDGIKAEANRKRSEAAKGNDNAAKAKKNSGGTKSSPTVSVASKTKPGKAAKAAASKTNAGAVARGDKLTKHAPDLADEVRQGKLKSSDAHKELRKRQREAKEKAAAKKVVGVLWNVTNAQKVIQCDALITDPPYGILNQPWEPAKIESFTREWATRWNECGAAMVAVFFSQRYLWDARKWFDESFTNYHFQQLLVWHYPNNKKPQSEMGFKQTWEPVLFYRLNGSTKKVQLHGGQWGDGLNSFDCHVAAVPQSNFNDENAKVHPAQKPVSVMAWLVNALTMPGEMVIDPFCGSGTTGIAAVKLQRKFHGIETDANYLKLAKQRIAAYGEQL
jgi:DNA modification methylase